MVRELIKEKRLRNSQEKQIQSLKRKNTDLENKFERLFGILKGIKTSLQNNTKSLQKQSEFINHANVSLNSIKPLGDKVKQIGKEVEENISSSSISDK